MTESDYNVVHQNQPGRDLPIVYAIFGGDKLGHTPSQRKAYNIGLYRDPEVMQVNLAKAVKSYSGNNWFRLPLLGRSKMTLSTSR